MSQSNEHPLEPLLHIIAAVAPQPWYFQVHARERGVDPASIVDALELLWMEGLLEKGTGTPETGPGVQLTPLGQQVLQEPELLARFRQRQRLGDDRRAILLDSLRRPIRPVVTWILLVANFAVFAFQTGLLPGVNGPLLPFRPLLTGVSAGDILRGEWWRLLTCCFVHGGALHLALNMWTLYAAGKFVEQTWGHWRFLLIYLVAGWGGSCLAVAFQPTNVSLVGASGALCGVLAADGVWIFLNSRQLPRALVQRGKSGFMTTLVLMVFISMMPGVSWQGHLGGAVLGGLTAILLHVQRFGAKYLRVLALLPILALPWLSYVQMQDATSRTQAALQDRTLAAFNDRLLPRFRQTMRTAISSYRDSVHGVREQNPARREKEDVERALVTLTEQVASLDELVEYLQRHRSFLDPEVEDARQKALAYARVRLEWYREAKRCLEAGANWKNADEKRLADLEEQTRQRRQDWEDLFKR